MSSTTTLAMSRPGLSKLKVPRTTTSTGGPSAVIGGVDVARCLSEHAEGDGERGDRALHGFPNEGQPT